MLKAVKERAADAKEMLRFVAAVVSERLFQTQLSARLESFEEAVTIAEKGQNKQMAAEILQAVERKRNVKIATRWKRIINK
jgi:RNA-binding protein YhbY